MIKSSEIDDSMDMEDSINTTRQPVTDRWGDRKNNKIKIFIKSKKPQLNGKDIKWSVSPKK